MKVFIMAEIKGGGENDLLRKLNRYPEVKISHLVFGEYDIIMAIEVKSAGELGKFIIDKIRSLPEIKNTKTLIVADE